MKLLKDTIFICLCFFSIPSFAREWEFQIEGGIINTTTMEIKGYGQNNATEGWESIDPTVRLEFWSKNPDGWNFGSVLQPVYLRFKDTFRSQLNFEGKTYTAGTTGTLNYQFHNFRETFNYPLLRNEDSSQFLRGGVSLIARYAQVDLNGSGNTYKGTNFLVIPLLNLESKLALSKDLSFIIHTDFFPGIDGDVFLDGLYDVLFSVKKTLDYGSLEMGTRLFFGGYDPKKIDEYSNRIFLAAYVLRFNF